MTGLGARLSPVRRLRALRDEFDRAIFVLALGDLVASFGFSLVFPFLTIYLTAELDASAAEAGLVLGLYSIVSIVSTALGGVLADRVGRKPVMVVSILCTAVVIAAMGLVRDLAWVAGLTLVLGFVDPPFVPAARAAVADVVAPERRPRAYGLLGMAASVGWIVGPSVGAGLSSLGFGVLFVAAGVIVAGYAVILLVGLRETRPAAGAAAEPAGAAAGSAGAEPAVAGVAPVDSAAATMAAEAAANPVPGDAPALPGAETTRRPFGVRRVFASFLVLAAVFHGVQFLWVAILPIFAYDLGVSTATWGLLFALNGILILALQLRISSLSERRSRPRFMAAGAVCSALAYLVVAGMPGAALVLPFLAGAIVLVTFGEMAFFPVAPSFVSDLSPVAIRGRYQGYLGAATGLGSAMAPALAGAVLDVAPGPAVWLGAAAVCGLVAGGLWWLGGRVPAGLRAT
jgi:MFS family permease